MQQIRQVNGLDDCIWEDDPQTHRHLAVVKVNYHRVFAPVDFLASLPAMRVAHLLVVHLNHVLAVVQAEHDALVCAEERPPDAVVVQQVVLLAAFFEVHLELSVLLLFAQSHQLPHDVPENLLKLHSRPALLCDLEEHVLEADHVQRHLLEGELHDLDHDGQEVLHAALVLRQALELALYCCQLLLKNKSADVRGRVFLERLIHCTCEVLFCEVETDPQSLLAVDESFEGGPVLCLLLLFQFAQHFYLLLLGLAEHRSIKLLSKKEPNTVLLVIWIVG